MPEGLTGVNGVVGEGQPAPLYQLGGLWERCKLPQRGPGGAPAPKGFLVFCAVRLPFPASRYVLHTVCMASY